MKLSLKARIAGTLGAVVLLALVSSGITFYQLSEIGQVQQEIKTVRIPLALSAERASRAVSDASFQFRNYIIYGEDPALGAKYDGLRQAAWKNLFDTIEQMKPLASEADKQTLAQLEDHARNGSLQIQIDTMPGLAGHGSEARRQSLERMKAGAGLAAKVQSDCDELEKSVQDALDQDNERLSGMQSTAKISSVILLVAMVALVALMGMALFRQIAAFVQTLDGRMRMISEGDLRGEALLEDSGDEIALVYGFLNTMQKGLKETIHSVSAGAERMASASEELSSSANQIAESSETQKNQTAQVATAMQEMTATVAEVGDASEKAQENARSAGELAKTGGQIVAETVQMIRNVAESTRETAAKIEELGRSGDQIGVIIGVIDDIADQTNLLALNAAIEAARAGEQGRGFAVVADEVRKLAERTTKATKEVTSMIETIQQETKRAVTATEESTSKVDAGVQAANQASDALKKIIESSERMQDMVTHIATAAVEQTAAAKSVNDSMDEIAKMAQQSSVGAKESAKACQDLSELGLDLQQLVSKFKTGSQEERRTAIVPRAASPEQAMTVQ